ncbi:MAG: NDP-sugar synthase [Phycisphaerae bacterium]|nr:NDP-sugar synthase [Phycisphaerae bacterium]
MIENLFDKDNRQLKARLNELGYQPASQLASIILVGGKGTRLAEARKRIDPDDYPALDPSFHGRIGPKGLAIMEGALPGRTVRAPLTDWHLEIHAACREVTDLTLALGSGGDIIRSYYYQVHGGRFRGRPVHFLVEERPAGTLAPLVKLHTRGHLPETPVVYANGDNLTDVDLYQAYLVGCLTALESGRKVDDVVIDIIAMVPWELSHECGTVDLDYDSGHIHAFREKCPKENNPYIEVDGRKVTPINSGISIVVNPASVYGRYFAQHPQVVETSQKLESGELDYKPNEAVVKYETAYQLLAAQGLMIGVYHRGSYWADLGTEEKILAAEQAFPASRIFTR